MDISFVPWSTYVLYCRRIHHGTRIWKTAHRIHHGTMIWKTAHTSYYVTWWLLIAGLVTLLVIRATYVRPVGEDFK